MKNNSQTSEDNRDSGLLSNPLSFLRSGYFDWSTADQYNRGGTGLYWSLRSSSTGGSNDLYFNNTNLYPQDSDYRGRGFAVRCVEYVLSGGVRTLRGRMKAPKACDDRPEGGRPPERTYLRNERELEKALQVER